MVIIGRRNPLTSHFTSVGGPHIFMIIFVSVCVNLCGTPFVHACSFDTLIKMVHTVIWYRQRVDDFDSGMYLLVTGIY